MKNVTVVVSGFFFFAGLFAVGPIVRIEHLFQYKLQADVRAANAQERVAIALERAYPVPVVVSSQAPVGVSSQAAILSLIMASSSLHPNPE